MGGCTYHKWYEMAFKLEGKTIKAVRPMKDEELKSEDWENTERGVDPMVIVLEDGSKLFPSRDEEGNDFGILFGQQPDGQKFDVRSGEE